MIEADVPRVDCKVHGVRQAKVPFPAFGFEVRFILELLEDLAGLGKLFIESQQKLPLGLLLCHADLAGNVQKADGGGNRQNNARKITDSHLNTFTLQGYPLVPQPSSATGPLFEKATYSEALDSSSHSFQVFKRCW
jgi:hypothetical protein